jgi:ABC-type transporter MlaC component
MTNYRNGNISWAADPTIEDAIVMNRRFLFRFLILPVLAIGLGSTGLVGKAQAEDPSSVISSVANKAISQIANGGSWSSRRSAARSIVSSRFDVRGAARFAAGSAWKSASSNDQSAYASAFEAMLVERLLDIFEDYSGETIKVVRASQDSNNGKYYNVDTVVQGSGRNIDVAWRLRVSGGKLKAIDVKPKGLSMLQAIRKEYKSVLSRNGGDLGDLASQIRTIVDKSVAKRS